MTFLLALLASALVVRTAMPLAQLAGIVDMPAGHKTHQRPVPYVGGFGVLAGLLCFGWAGHRGWVPVEPTALYSLLACGLIIFFTGLADDRWTLTSRIRLVIATAASAVMIFGAGVVLVDLGELLPGIPLALGWLAIPVTVFGMLSVTNALNMIDGIDGLSGSLSFISLVLLAAAAHIGGAEPAVVLAVSLAGGVLGFLVFNMRCCGRRSAAVYLGDNGSMLVGFLLGWLFIDLSQGERAAIAPVTALYFFSVPLFDSAMAIIRRVWMGRSPFAPDRNHLHHLLLDAGASVPTAVKAIALLHALIGMAGLAAFYAGVPEWLLFAAYVAAFAAYGFAIARPWRFVPLFRRLLVRSGVTLEHGTGVFIGGIDPTQAPQVLAQIRAAVRVDAGIRAFCETRPDSARDQVYFVVDLGSWYAVRPTINRLRGRLAMFGAFEIRQYVQRNPVNDRRAADREIHREQRRRERRGAYPVHELLELRIDETCRTGRPSARPLAA